MSIPTHAQDQSYTRWADRVLAVLQYTMPLGSQRCTAEVVRDLVRPRDYGTESVGTSNIGLNKHFQELIDHESCYANRLTDFWNKLNQLPADNPEMAVKISEAAGDGRFASYPPGWLWQRALKESNNEPYGAMMLLGPCMHDDHMKSFQQTLSREVLSQEIKDLQDRLPHLEGDEVPYFTEVLNSKKRQFLSLENASSTRTKTFKCPPKGSPIMAPKSLASELITSEEMKNRLMDAQKIDRDPKGLPAKAYHLYTGALIACELTKCGVTKERASEVAQSLATAYRLIRLCPAISALYQQQSALSKKLGLSADSPEFNFKAREELGKGMIFGYPNMSKEEVASRKMREQDAARLFVSWYVGRGLMKQGIPLCTSVRYNAKNLNESMDCKINGWSKERCAAAVAKLKTWDIDIPWTRHQQKLGAEFGFNQCNSANANNKSRSLCPKAPSSVEGIRAVK